MAIATVELIIFAVQAGIKLAQAGRQVFVERTQEGGVTLPLPPAFVASPLDHARAHVGDLLKNTSPDDQVRFKKLLTDSHTSNEAAEELIQLHISLAARGGATDLLPKDAKWAALFRVNQWQSGKEPNPSSLQRIGGALVEVAVDYFVHVPGAINAESKHGKVLKSFLAGLDEVSFQDARGDAMALALFTSALDALKDNPELLTDEEDKQSLIKKIVVGVAQDIKTKLGEKGVGNIEGEEKLKRFGQIVLRSLLKNAGTAIVEDPTVLGLEKAGKVLVQSVGSTFLELLLGDEEEEGTLGDALRRVASTDGLDKLIRAALKAATEYPEYFDTGNQAIDKWLQNVLKDLYDRRGEEGQGTFFDPEIFAEVAYVAIEHGLRDLPVLLKASDTTSAVIVDIARKVFDVMTEQPESGKPRWRRLELSRSDIQNLFTGVITSIVSHTQWFVRRPKVLGAMVDTVPVVVQTLADLYEGKPDNIFKPLLRSNKLHTLIAAVLASEVIDPKKHDTDKIVKGITAVLKVVWADGMTGADRLLDENVLFDLLLALADSGAATKLFGDDQDVVNEVVARLRPILVKLRGNQVLTVVEMTAALRAA